MGFDIQRFPNCIDEELICSICGGVLQDPLQAPSCEHTFCQVKRFNHFLFLSHIYLSRFVSKNGFHDRLLVLSIVHLSTSIN